MKTGRGQWIGPEGDLHGSSGGPGQQWASVNFLVVGETKGL